MNKVTFKDYWNTFFCWAGDYKQTTARIKKEARQGYKDYCRHIEQEPVWN